MTQAAIKTPIPAEPASLTHNRAFLQLWAAQVLSQTATNAIIYALMVLIEQRTQSSIYMSLLVLSTIVPSVVFGLGAGVFVDRWRKRNVLWITNALRALAVVGFVPASVAAPALSLGWVFAGTGFHDAVVDVFSLFYQNLWLNLGVIYGMNLIFSTVTQFFAPAEISMLPALVRRKQLIEANGLFNLTFTGSQLVGFVFLGPGLVKTFGISVVFVVMAVLFVVAAALTRTLPDREPFRGRKAAAVPGDLVGDVISELREGWAVLTHDRFLTLAIVNFTVANALMLIVGALAPGYVNRVLGIPPEDAVVIMAPAGVGILLGISVLRRLVAHFGNEHVANAGMFLTTAVLFALGVVGSVGPGLAERGQAFLATISRSQLPLLVGTVMALALALGVAYAMINVPAQTTLQERTPEDKRGRVFATQLTFTNVVAIFPLIFLSGLADLLGINKVIVLAAAIVFLVALVVRRYYRRSGAPIALEHER